MVRQKWATAIPILILTMFVAAACTSPPQTSYDGTPANYLLSTPALAETAAAMGTMAANTGLVYQSTIAAATRHAEETAAAIQATSTAGAAYAASTSTTQAQYVQSTATAAAVQTAAAVTVAVEQIAIERMRQEAELDLAMTRAGATSTAQSRATEDAAALQRYNIELTRAAQENEAKAIELQAARNWNNFKRSLPWVAVIFTFLGVGMFFYFQIRKDTPQEIVTSGGARVTIITTPEGRRPLMLPNNGDVAFQGTGNALPTYLITDGRGGNDQHPLALTAGSSYTPGQREPVYLPNDLPVGIIGLGVTPSHRVWYRFEDMKDMLVAGTKGSGKSTFLQMLSYQAERQKWETYYIDAEQITFDPQMWGTVAQSTDEVIALLHFLVNSIFQRRFELYREAAALIRDAYDQGQIQTPFKVDNLTAYNKAARMFGLPALAPAILFWDEAASHFGDSTVQKLLHDFIRRSRKPGFRAVLASQSWHVSGPDGISNVIRARLEKRIAFRTDAQGSNVVLGSPVAATIPEAWKGHAITLRDSDGKPGRMQGYYLPDRLLFEHIRPETVINSDDHTWWPPTLSSGSNGANGNGTGNTAGVIDLITEMEEESRQAEEDAALLATNPPSKFRSRRSVATFLTFDPQRGKGIDNEYAYNRADEALTLLLNVNDMGWDQKAAELLSAKNN